MEICSKLSSKYLTTQNRDKLQLELNKLVEQRNKLRQILELDNAHISKPDSNSGEDEEGTLI